MSDSSNASSLPTMPPTSKPNQPKMVKKPQSNLLANTTEERSDDMAKAFDAQGSFGKKFTAEGAVGGIAQKMGGPLDKNGMVGKQFTTAGSIGGMVQEKLGGEKKSV